MKLSLTLGLSTALLIAMSASSVAALPANNSAVQDKNHWGDALGQSVNLLETLDLERDAVSGDSELKDNGLVIQQNKRALVNFPAEVPEQYQLTMVVERLAGQQSLFLGLPVQGGYVAVGLDSFRGKFSGLNQLDGAGERNNLTTYRRQLLPWSKRRQVTVTVHKGHIHAAVDGETFLDWHGSPQRLSVSGDDWEKLDQDNPSLVSYGALWRVVSLELRPIEKSTFDDINIAGGKQPADPADSVVLVETAGGTGSGFVVGPNLLATNYHVIRGSMVADITVSFPGRSEKVAVDKLLYVDPQRDLALLAVSTPVPPLALAWDGVYEVGEKITLHGNPTLGGGVVLRNAETSGVVSAEVQIAGADFLQLDANINPGSSGGPVLNERGQVIGVIAMKATVDGEEMIRKGMEALDESTKSTADSLEAGIAFGIPSAHLAAALDEVLQADDKTLEKTNAHYDLGLLWRRMMVLTSLSYMQALATAGPEIERQAQLAQARGQAGALLKLLPAAEAAKARQEFASKETQAVIQALSANLDRDLENLRSNRAISSRSKSSLRTLRSTLDDLAEFTAERHVNYVNFSSTMRGFERRISQNVGTVAKELGVEPPR